MILEVDKSFERDFKNIKNKLIENKIIKILDKIK